MASPVPRPFKALHFRNLGPAVAGGRVTSVVGIPGNPNVYYVGAASGGVWKTSDGGNDWKALLQYADTASIGAIALAPSNPNLVWVGTGEANPRNDVIKGGGVYFSPDQGESWQFMGLKDVGQISSILINPTNPDLVYVCALGNVWKSGTHRGVYVSDDGGRHWQKTLYISGPTGCSSLAMQPGNPKVLIAGMWETRVYPWVSVHAGSHSGIYRSTDGGMTWQRLTNGLPSGMTGRSAISFAPSAPETVYALIQAQGGLLWVSHDGGGTWQFVSNNHTLDSRPFYFSQLAVAPDNSRHVIFLSGGVMESEDGGETIAYADRGVHPDHHAIWIDPTNANRIIQGNDGGVALSTNGGKNWRYLNYLPIEQIYSLGIGNTKPFFVCGGLQDNWVWCGDSTDLGGNRSTLRNWWTVTGGDGQYVVPAPSDPNVIYADAQNGNIVRFDRNQDTSQVISPYLAPLLGGIPVSKQQYRFNWTSPIAVSYNNPNEIYLGANVVFQSMDGGSQWRVISPDLTRNDKAKQQGEKKFPSDSLNWQRAYTYDTIQSISLSRLNPQVIWAGTDDGLVWVTRNGGDHWTNVTPNAVPKWARIYQIGVSPFDPGTVYVAVDAHLLGNDQPYVYSSNDYGRTWVKITNGIPNDDPVVVVREDPSVRGLLFAGTMRGLYYSRDAGTHWQRLIANLPTMPIWDIKFVKSASSLVLGSHGRGIWVLDNLRPVEEFTQSIAQSDFHLFTPAPGTLYHPAAIERPILPSYVAPKAHTGVVLSYYVGKPSPEVPDSSPSKPNLREATFKVETTNGRLVAEFSQSVHPGINEEVWNLRYKGPVRVGAASNDSDESNLRGPHVVPGSYVITVTYAGKSYKTSAVVTGDPRINVSEATYAAITSAGLTVRNELDVLNTSVNNLRDTRSRLSNLMTLLNKHSTQYAAEYESLLNQARDLDRKISDLTSDAYNPYFQRSEAEDRQQYLSHIHGQLQNLYGIVTNRLFVAPPSVALQQLMAEQHSILNKYLAKYNKLMTEDVRRFNLRASQLNVPYSLPAKKLTLPQELGAQDVQN